MSIFPTKILLATDGSKDAWLATNSAIGLAMVTGSELQVVNVGVAVPALLKPLGIKPARVEQEARRLLDEEVKNIENVGGTVARSHLMMGDAAQEIVNLAEEQKVGLIAIGSRGRGRIERALIGSVSDSVVRHAHCPVLVMRKDRTQTQPLSGEASSVLDESGVTYRPPVRVRGWAVLHPSTGGTTTTSSRAA